MQKELNLDQIAAIHKEEKKVQSPKQYELSAEDQKKIVELVLWKAEQYDGARAEWRKQVTSARKLYDGSTDHVRPPWADAPLISTMVTTWVVDTLAAKLFPLIWNENLIYWKGRDKADIDQCEKIRKFMRWVITRELKMAGVIEEVIQDLLIDGTFAVKIRWEVMYKWIQRRVATGIKAKTIEGIQRIFKKYDAKYEYKKFEKPMVERLEIDDVLFPWDAKNSDDCDIIHRVYNTYNDLKDLQTRGYVRNVDESIIADTDEKAENLKGSLKVKVEQEGMSQHDRIREENPIECYEAYLKYPINGKMIESVFFVSKTAKKFLSGKPLVSISRIEKRPIFAYSLFGRSGRLLGKSAAMMVAPLHKEMDAIHNQRIHAGTIAISPPGFYRPASGFKPKKQSYGPGYLTPLDDPQKDVVFPNFSAQLLQVSFQEEQNVLSLVERLSTISSYMLGKESEVVKSRATATGTMALIGQAEQKFNAVAKRVQDSVAELLIRVLQQYQQFMPPGLDKRILGEGGESLFPEGMAPEDIAGEYDCYMELDFATSNKQVEQQVSQMMYQTLSQNPLVMKDPSLLWELTSNFIVSMGNKYPEKIIGNKPPSLESYDADADVEFSEMMAGKKVQVKPNENGIAHLIAHVTQRKSDRFVVMPDEYKPLLDEHIQKTQVLVQQQMQKQIEGAAAAQDAAQAPGGIAPGQGGGLEGSMNGGQGQPTQSPDGAGGMGSSSGAPGGNGAGVGV